MQNELLIAILAGLGGMLGWGLADFFAKKTIDKIGDIASLALAHIFGTMVLFFAVLYKLFFLSQKIVIPHDIQTWGILLFFGILQAVIYYFVYKGFSKGQISLLNPVFASFSGLTSILSIVFVGEIVTGHLIFSLIVIFSGVLLLNLDIKALKTKRVAFVKIGGFKEIILATILASVWTLLWGKFIIEQDWLTYAFFMYTFMTVAILVIAKFKKINLSIPTKNIWVFLLLIGLCETVAYLAISLGYATTSRLSVVALLSGAFSLPTVILARIFLKEKVSITQSVGSIIIILGIIFLSLL